VHFDNAGIVVVVNKGHSWSTHTNDVLHRIYHLQLGVHVSLKAIYVESRVNITDALSRGNVAGFLKCFPHAFNKITFPLPLHLANCLLLC
jgi:hypothetical protein